MAESFCKAEHGHRKLWTAILCGLVFASLSADDYRRGLEAGLVYTDSKGMLRDRVAALRAANIYERQAYGHLVGRPAIPL